MINELSYKDGFILGIHWIIFTKFSIPLFLSSIINLLSFKLLKLYIAKFYLYFFSIDLDHSDELLFGKNILLLISHDHKSS